MNAEARVGSFLLAGLALIGFIIFKLGDFTLERQYPLTVTFKDVAGLPDKSIVKLSGVEVGKVQEITLEGDLAVVAIKVRRGVDVYKDAKFRIGSTSIIGSKFLQIDQGTKTAGKLESGARVEGMETVSLERAMAAALESVEGLLDGFKGTVGKDAPMMINLTASVQNMRELTGNMNDLLADVKPHLEKSMVRSDAITEKLDRLLAQTNELMAKLNSSTGTVGALLTDVKMKEDVQTTVANLKEASSAAADTLGRINQFRVYWDATGRHEPKSESTKGDVGLQIVPREGRYYYLGGSNLGSDENSLTSDTTDYEKKNTITALLGWTWPWGDFHAGAIRSSFGVGGKLTPFFNDPFFKRFSFFADVYELGRNRTILGRKFDSPAVDAGAEVQVQKHVRLRAAIAEALETRRFQASANVHFEDKDIAYLFGLATFASAGTKGRSSSK